MADDAAMALLMMHFYENLLDKRWGRSQWVVLTP
jgi:hypothetical protein